jgi:hypothetical protein
MKIHHSPPSIVDGYIHDSRGQFFVVVPEASINRVINPAFEHTDFDRGYSPDPFSGITINRGTGNVRRWYACAEVSGPASSWIETTAYTSKPPPWTFSLDIRVFDLSSIVALELMYPITDELIYRKVFQNFPKADEWYRLYITYFEKNRNHPQNIKCVLRLVNGQTVRTDGWQFEEKPYPTTYFDGDMDVLKHPGYGEELQWWDAEPHSSVSHRSKHDRAGGRLLSLSDISPLISTLVDTQGTYCERAGIQITGYSGLDAASIKNSLTPYLGDGSRLMGTTAPERQFSLRGRIAAQSANMYNAIRGALTRLFTPDGTIPQQPASIIYRPYDCNDSRFMEYERDIEIRCLYQGGLEGNRHSLYQEDVEIKFVCPEPRLFQVGSTAFQAGTNQGLSTKQVVHGVLRRLSERKVANAPLRQHEAYKLAWDNIGDGPLETFTSTVLQSGFASVTKVSPLGYIYFGGAFTADSTGTGGFPCNNLVRFVPNQDSLHGGQWYDHDMPTRVHAIVFDLNRRAWFGGDFGLAYSDFEANGTPGINFILSVTEPVYTLALDRAGDILIGGAMPTYNYLAIIDRDTLAVQTFYGGTDGSVHEIAIGLDNSIYVSGSFLNAGGAPAGKIAKNKDGLWLDLSSDPADGTVITLEVSRSGVLYAGGDFQRIGGINANAIAKFNGAKWEPLGGGLVNASGIDGGAVPVVQAIQARHNGEIWVSGERFDRAGGKILLNPLAIWTGSSWLPADVHIPNGNAAEIYGIDESPSGDLYFAGAFSGVFSGTTKSAFNYWGNARTYPEFKYTNGGHYHLLGNYTTNKFIYLNLSLLTTDQTALIHASPSLPPRLVTRESSSTVYADISHTMLSNSDWIISLEPSDKPLSRQVSIETRTSPLSSIEKQATIDYIVPSNVLASFKRYAVDSDLGTNGIHVRFRVAHWGVGDVEGARF